MDRCINALLIICLFAAGCASDSKEPGRTTYTPATGSAAATEPPVPVAPRDAQWTIHCMSIVNPDHVNLARRMRANLASSTNLKDWYVVHGQDKSDLFYGYYRSINDASDRAESERAQKDRAMLDGLRDSQSNRPFSRAIFVNIDVGDPTAPPEWDLTNAPGYYTLVVQQFKDHPKRKEAAVQAVRDFRVRNIQAYYFHSAAASAVCIGTWPKEAVRGDISEIRAENPGQTVDSVRGPKPEVVDPTLLETMRKYPELAINYELIYKNVPDPKTGKTHKKYKETYVAAIPRKAPSQGILNAGATAAPIQPPRRAEPRPDTGKLRSIQD